MERKLVQQGVSTLMVSLPRKWIQQQQLTKGSLVTFKEISGNLVISTNRAQHIREITLDITGEEESLVRTMITNAYRTGVDKVSVRFKTKNQYDILQNVVKTRLLGYQITQKEKDKCTIESMTEPDAGQFDNIFSKFFYSTNQLIACIKQTSLGLKIEDDIEELEERIQQYVNFCLRCLSKQAQSSNSDFLRLLITGLNHGQRDCFIAFKSGVASTDKSLIETISLLFELVYMSYISKKTDKLHLIHEKYKSLEKQRKNKPNTASWHLLSASRQFYLASSALTGWIILVNQNKN